MAKADTSSQSEAANDDEPVQQNESDQQNEADEFNQSYDEILVNINTSDDDFDDHLLNRDDLPPPAINHNLLSDIDQMGNAAACGSQSQQPLARLAAQEGRTQVGNQSRADKFASWRNDPEFKVFIAEVLSEMNDLSARKKKEDEATALSKKKGKSGRHGPTNDTHQLLINRSPSDTMIYQPAFQRSNAKANDAIVKISNFVDSMWISSEEIGQRKATSDQRPSKAGTPAKSTPKKDGDSRREITTRMAAENEIVDAEIHKAGLQPPRGISPFHIQGGEIDIQKLLNKVDGDDKFFNVMCHIDPTLHTKIERGEFIDLK